MAEKAGPFEGVTVVDLTRVLAGPYCTMVLADLGARVIKVEMPERGDDARHIGPFIEGRSAYFMSVNRGKQSIALDLKDDDDRAVFFSLLEGADVLVENFRASTMEKLGLGWDVLHERFPTLIYAAASGFGHSGPYAEKPAYDMVVQAMGGIMSLTGHPGGPPTRVGSSIGDITAGLFTAIGISSALYHRAQTGEALKVDVSMLDAQVGLLENAIARYQATGEVPGPLGTRHPSITPFQAVKAQDRWMVIAAGNDKLFARLCEVIGVPGLVSDPRFATNALRSDHQAELEAALMEAFGARPAEEWISLLEGAGVPCGPINTVADVLADPQVNHRRMVIETDDPAAGAAKMAGNPVKLSGFDDPLKRPPAPALDEHRAEILETALPGQAPPLRSR